MNFGGTAVLGAGPVFGAGDPTDLIQFGALGVVVMLILFGFLEAKPAVDRLIRDKEAAEAQRDALVDVYQTEVIPALAQVNQGLTRVADQVVPLMTETKALLERVQVIIETTGVEVRPVRRKA